MECGGGILKNGLTGERHQDRQPWEDSEMTWPPQADKDPGPWPGETQAAKARGARDSALARPASRGAGAGRRGMG